MSSLKSSYGRDAVLLGHHPAVVQVEGSRQGSSLGLCCTAEALLIDCEWDLT